MASGRRRLLLTLVAGFVAAGVVTAAILWPRGPSAEERARPRRAQLLAYEAAAVPLFKKGGEVVQLGLKPGIGDIRTHHFNDGVLRGMTEAWRRDLTTVRDGLRKLPGPGFLADAVVFFREAADGYVHAAQALYDAARVEGPGREMFLQLGADLGAQADRIFDRGAAIIQSERRALGMPPNHDLPNG